MLRLGRMLAVGWGIILATVLSGCGGSSSIESSRTSVTGAVEFDGQPLPGGSVTLVSIADPQRRTTAMIRPDGTFSVADAPRGPVRITVETDSLQFGAPVELYVPIPARYAKIDTSQLSGDIRAGGEPLNVVLTP